MNRSEFLKSLAELLQEDPATVTPETPMESIAAWDSMGMLTVIAFFDRDIGVQVDVDLLRKCGTLGDVMALAGGKIAS
jgi:acyl carrier protein